MEDYTENLNSNSRDILSVSEVNQTADDFLRDIPPLWVSGEISGFKAYPSGHWYFSIKDSEAVLRCVMFKGDNNKVLNEPKEGDQLILFGKLSVYKRTGSYQMTVRQMELAGFGELMRKFELLKNKLNSEGLFETKNSEQLPDINNKIAIITSSKGAAIRDVISTLKRRSPHTEILIAPTIVQGEQSPNSILQSLKLIETQYSKNNIDAAIICRGGGSIEDLWAFNNEEVCRYIAQMKTPIISGVGHETDFTLTDFVSNYRAATPTAAAEIISEGSSRILEYFENAKLVLHRNIITKIKEKTQSLHFLKKQLRTPKQKLNEQQLRLDEQHERIELAIKNFLSKKINLIDIKFAELNNVSPKSRLVKISNSLNVLKTNLNHQLLTIVSSSNSKLQLIQEKIHALDPKGVLNRGYSITTDEKNRVIKDAKRLKKGEEIQTLFSKGKVKSKVS
ncbi:MAG: exodeoxyribonuclease VII large subunit [SAR86 cluster bacterium]|jgi:exodeoxyribonuclease VII large subunit|nr:MAG: exodeoxyribonuclease VII large subunit [SAR86 cluster bacterium]|tara:strand:+ start:8608 stop:9957 length:1350 start_codon:yes stop_codon:yes gene_type:complete